LENKSVGIFGQQYITGTNLMADNRYRYLTEEEQRPTYLMLTL